MPTDAYGREIVQYRREKITHTPGFARPYGWLGTRWFATLDEVKADIDAAAWNQ